MSLPLDGTLIIDASRMLPGAVLARRLLDLGARLIKVEEPGGGDPMRLAPPIADGIGAGFAHFHRGAESICLDLRDEEGAGRLRALVRHADVFVESFRAGTLETWGAGPARLQELNPTLVVCSLPGFATLGPDASRVGHDLNFVASSGLLSLLPGDDVPRVQIADVGAGLLACSSILAALLERGRTGRGCRIEQPLEDGVRPFLAWAAADLRAGGPGVWNGILAGRCPAYGIYDCEDGLRVAVGAIEPKFWSGLLDLLGLEDLDGVGLDTGDEGEVAMAAAQRAFETRPREHWLAGARERGLPVTPVQDLDRAVADREPGEDRPPPRLGEHTERIVREFGL